MVGAQALILSYLKTVLANENFTKQNYEKTLMNLTKFLLKPQNFLKFSQKWRGKVGLKKHSGYENLYTCKCLD